jgi:TusA-related sulfurtransferase
MQKFTQTSNGRILEIHVNESALYAQLDEDIKEMEDLKTEVAAAGGEEAYAHEHNEDEEEYLDEHEYYADYKYEYAMQKVGGDINEFCTPDEIIADRNSFKESIQKIIADNGSTLWEMVQLKKNGTFKKTSKPTIRTAINGSYWEDSYGWNTLVLRIVPHSDTVCHVELDHIVEHW